MPPITNADANARGTATITLNLTRDASGTITGGDDELSCTASAAFPRARVILARTSIEGGPAIARVGVKINSGLTAANADHARRRHATNITFYEHRR